MGPRARATSPHLAQLDVPGAFDDGVIVGEGTLDGRRVLAAAQEGAFIGGSVGEVHGAKIVGLLERARPRRGPTACCCCSTPAACACMKPTPD